MVQKYLDNQSEQRHKSFTNAIGYRGGDVKFANRSAGGKTQNTPGENAPTNYPNNMALKTVYPIYLKQFSIKDRAGVCIIS